MDFYREIELWQHDKNCDFKQNKDDGDDGARMSVTVQSCVMLSAATMADVAMFPEVNQAFSKLHARSIKTAIVDDKILLRLAGIVPCSE